MTTKLADSNTSADAILSNILCAYFRESLNLREYHEDISNLDFHRRFGLLMQVPEHWDIYSALSSLLLAMKELQKKQMLVIYSNSVCYKETFAVLDDNVTYISWHEIHTAMLVAASDPSFMRRIRELLNSVSITVLIDLPSTFSDILNQVRADSNGCLISIGSKS